MALLPTGTSADQGDAVPSDYWRKVDELLNRGSFYNTANPDYAVPDNGTTGASTAMQSLVNDAAAAGQPVIVSKPATAYLLNTPVTLPVGTGFCMIGHGWGSVFKLGSGIADYGFKFSTTAGNVTGALLANFAVDGNLSAAGAGSGCIYAKGAVQCRFDHLWLHHAVDASLWLHEIAGGNPGHHNRVTNCLFDSNSGSAGFGQGIRMQSSDENFITNCDFESLGGAGSEPYAIKEWAGINQIVGNVFVGGKEAVRVQDTSGTRIIGNMFDGPGRTSVHIAGSGCVVSGNVFSGGGQDTAGTYSHVIQDGTGENVISGNYFNTDATAGRLRSFIRELGASVAGSVVTGNKFKVNGALGTAKVERNAQANTYRVNNGYATENSGTTAFGAAVTSVTGIAHGLDVTPAAKDFNLQYVADPLAGGHAWVSAITSTTFTLNVKTAPGGAGTTVGWQIQVL